MSFDALFWLAHVPAAVGWIALLLPIADFPARRRIAMACGAVVAAGYAALFFSSTDAAVLARNYSLSGVAAFFDFPHLQLAGWAHYLVLDLWAGIWQAEEGERTRMSRWLLVPSLVVTAMVGPVGLLLFLACRSASRRTAGPGALKN